MSKEYIKTRDNCVRRFRNDLSHQLKNLRLKNPEDYWKILNSTNKNKKCAVDINEMYTFMTDINKTDSEELTPSNLYTSPVSYDIQTLSDDLLNMPIQEEEIREAVKKLNKRPMGHIAHLRKQFKSINTYDYIITLIKRRRKNIHFMLTYCFFI